MSVLGLGGLVRGININWLDLCLNYSELSFYILIRNNSCIVGAI